MLRYLQTHSYDIFVWYRLIAGGGDPAPDRNRRAVRHVRVARPTAALTKFSQPHHQRFTERIGRPLRLPANERFEPAGGRSRGRSAGRPRNGPQRRHTGGQGRAPPPTAAASRAEKPAEHEPLRIANLEIRPGEYQLLADGKRVGLTVREFQTFLVLAERPDRVVTRPEIYALVWGGQMAYRDRSVDVFVRKVRRKLGDLRAELDLHPHALRRRATVLAGARRARRSTPLGAGHFSQGGGTCLRVRCGRKRGHDHARRRCGAWVPTVGSTSPRGRCDDLEDLHDALRLVPEDAVRSPEARSAVRSSKRAGRPSAQPQFGAALRPPRRLALMRWISSSLPIAARRSGVGLQSTVHGVHESLRVAQPVARCRRGAAALTVHASTESHLTSHPPDARRISSPGRRLREAAAWAGRERLTRLPRSPRPASCRMRSGTAPAGRPACEPAKPPLSRLS